MCECVGEVEANTVIEGVDFEELGFASTQHAS